MVKVVVEQVRRWARRELGILGNQCHMLASLVPSAYPVPLQASKSFVRGIRTPMTVVVSAISGELTLSKCSTLQRVPTFFVPKFVCGVHPRDSESAALAYSARKL